MSITTSIKASTYSSGTSYSRPSPPGDAVKTIPARQQYSPFKKKVNRGQLLVRPLLAGNSCEVLLLGSPNVCNQ